MKPHDQAPLLSNPFITLLANQSSEALIILDHAFRIALFNQTAEKIFRLSKEQLVGELFNDLCAKSHIECFIDAYTYPLITIQETSTWLFNQKITWQIEPIDVDGRPYYLLKTMQWAEEKNRNEPLLSQNIASLAASFESTSPILRHDHKGTPAQTLEERNTFLNSIIEHLPQPVYWKDKNGIYLGGNKLVAERLNLKSSSDIPGKSDYDFNWSNERIKHLQHIDQQVIQSGLSYVVEDLIPVDDTLKIFLTSKTPLRNNQGEIIGILGVSTDISEQKKLENDLRHATLAAEAANLMKTKFITHMSHDIKTPLTGVVGMSNMLAENAIDSKQKSHARMLCDSSEQLLNMLNGILDAVSADSANEHELHEASFSLHRMIQNIVKLERPTTIVKGLELITTVDDSIPTHVWSDQTKLHRILLNLLSNAIKFTKTGHVNIGAKLLKQNETHAVIQFHVKDTGIGIPYELQDKVFDRFFRVAPADKGINTGHGVGLHIAQSYVHLLGGTILLTSEPNVGTTFYFDLSLRIDNAEESPLSAALESSSPQTQAFIAPTIISTLEKLQQNPLKPQTPMLLLIEDNAIALLILENLVAKYGYDYMHAKDGLEALTLATTYHFDLIITDLGLPNLSGIEFTQQLRAYESEHHKPSIPIIGLTAHANMDIKNRCIAAGMNETYTKPLTADGLEQVMSVNCCKFEMAH